MIFESFLGLIIIILLSLMFSMAVKSYTKDKHDERDYK